MHPEIIKNKSGKCPKCGMELVPVEKNPEENVHTESEMEDHREHDMGKHAGHSTQMFLRKFWVSLALTIPVLLYADISTRLFGFTMPTFYGSEYLPFVLGSIVFFYGGIVFLKGALNEIKSRLPGMMTLISLAITAAYLWSVYATFAGLDVLYWELTTLITIMLLGHWIEMKAVSGVQDSLKALAKLLPDEAEVIRGDEIKTIQLSELLVGDIVLVRPGSKLPADGEIVEGETNLDESMVTGESKPIPKKAGDQVIAGTINGEGALKVRVNNIGEKTFLAGVMRLVAEAQSSKSRLQMLSDRAALYLTIIAVVVSIITLTAWLLSGAEVDFAVARLVAVLVIACPHALGLAVPLVASISTTKAAQNGFLVKQRLALEAARTIDTVLFDKTGTLTKGEFGVIEIFSIEGRTEEEVLGVAATVDLLSEHPIAKAIVSKSKEMGIKLDSAQNFEAIKGKGVRAMIGGKKIMVGGPSLLESIHVSIPQQLSEQIQYSNNKGQTVVFVVEDNLFVGAIALADVIREESREAIKSLNNMGVKTVMVTGDSEDVAKWVSQELGIDEYFARVLPDKKSEKVKELQKRKMKVAMVGDGINDAPALTQADLGIAVGAGTNVAIESAGIILARNDPRDIGKIITLSKLTYSKMIQNIFWATGYNIVALPLAAGILASRGILLEPAVAAVFMSMSTVIVAINAILLRNRELE
jgi:Cu2+-exporting ATPase